MKRFYFVAVFATLALLCGCSKAVDEGKAVEVAKSELSIGLPIGISRTAVDDEGKASWVEGDTFALWAENTTGQLKLEGAEFQMMYYWHSYQSAVFTSQANALAEGDYTYYAVSPKPQSTNGLKATYTIPAEQNGTSFNGGYDIMVATPVEAEALSAEKVNNLALDFQHKMHTLKMTIAKNSFNSKVSKLIFTFPSEVTGKVTVDAANPDAAPVLENASRELTIDCGNGITNGNTVWAAIIPQAVSGEASYYAVSELGQLTNTRKFLLDRELKEGHITPLQLSLPEVIPPTILRFTIGTNNLGEAIQNITLIDSNGVAVVTLAGNSNNEFDWIEYPLYENGTFKNYVGQTFTVRYESAHAIVEDKVQIPSSINKQAVTNITINVPYLFFEDFSSIHTNFDKDDYSGGSLMTSDGILLDSYMGVTGWNAAHVKGVIGQCVRVNVRHEYTMGATRTNGRLDSPAMKGLKAGANVTLKVEFGMGSYGTNDKEIYCFAGMHTDSESSPLNGWNETKAFGSPSNDASRIPALLSTLCYSSGNIAQKFNNDSFGASFPTHSFTASGCTSETRFVWVPGTNNTTWSGIGNAHYYLYIDNVRVSIAQ
jgi:hypothetical protein